MAASDPGPTRFAGRIPARRLAGAELRALAALGEGACVSIYLPLEPLPPASQNAVRARAAVAEALDRLSQLGVEGAARARWSARLEEAAASLAHARDQRGSVAILADAASLHAIGLSARLAQRVAVGSRPLLRPLLAALALETPYRVLAVSAKRVAVLEGDALGLHPAELGELPASLEAALGSETSEKELRVRGTLGGGGAPVYYSHDARSDERKLDFERFRHVLAGAARRRFAGDRTPLVIAADAPHAAALRGALGELPGLVPETVSLSPDAATPAQIHARAWPLVAAALEARAGSARASWERARNAGKGVDLVSEAAADAASGRVRRLWVSAERRVPGTVDPTTGRLDEGRGDDDVLDDVAALVLRHGGEVCVVPDGALPGSTGLAAELR